MRFSTNFWDNALFGGDGAGGDGDSSPSITGYSVDPNTGSRSVTNSAGATTTWDASGNQTVSYGEPSSSGSGGGSSTTTQAPAQTAAPAKAPAQTTTAPAVTAAPAPAKTEAAPAPAPAQTTTAAPASLDPAPTTTSGLASAAPAATGSLSSSSTSGLTSAVAGPPMGTLGGKDTAAGYSVTAPPSTSSKEESTTAVSTAVTGAPLGTQGGKDTNAGYSVTPSASSSTGSSSTQSTSYTPSAREAENTSWGAYEAYDLSSTFGANNPHSNYDSAGNYSAPADYTTTSTGTGYNVSNYDPLGSARGLMSGANDPVSAAVASPSGTAQTDTSSLASQYASYGIGQAAAAPYNSAIGISSNSLSGSLANTAPSGTFTGTASLAAPTAVETGIPSYDSINSYARDIQANSRVDTPVTQTTSTAINSTNVVDPRSGYAPTSGLLSSPYSNGSREFTDSSSRVFSDIMGTAPKDDFSSRAALDATSLTAPGTSSFSTTGQPATSSQAAVNAGATSRQASVTDIGTSSTASPMYSPDRQAWDPQNTFESPIEGLALPGDDAGVYSARGVTTSSLPGILATTTTTTAANASKEVVAVLAAGAGWTTVQLADGTVETRDGVRGARNNNPGNIEYGDFAKSKGAIASDGRFAVFSTPEAGRKAMESLLTETPAYSDKTLSAAISRYAPPNENDTAGYISAVEKNSGVSRNTVMSDMNTQQISAVVDAMIEHEGTNRGYTVNGVKADTQNATSTSAPMSADQMADWAAGNNAPSTGSTSTGSGKSSTGTATATPISDAYSYDPTQGVSKDYVYDQNTAPGNPVAGLLGGLFNNPNGNSAANNFTNAVVGSQLYQGFNALYDATIGKMGGTTGPSEQPSFDGSVGADTNAFSSLTPPEEETTEVDPEERFEETYLFWSPYRPTPTFRF